MRIDYKLEKERLLALTNWTRKDITMAYKKKKKKGYK